MDPLVEYSSEEEITITVQPTKPMQRAASPDIEQDDPPAAQAAAPADKSNVLARMMMAKAKAARNYLQSSAPKRKEPMRRPGVDKPIDRQGDGQFSFKRR